MKAVGEYLDEALREIFNERAGIMEHMGGLPREKAEALARAEVATFRKALEKQELAA